MKPTSLVVGLCLAIAGAACGSAPSDAGANTGSAATTTGSAAPSTSAATVVPHERLAALLPTIPGFTRESDVKGTTDTEEKVSRVQVDYIQEGGGTAGLSVEMMDVAMNAVMLAPIKESLRIQGTRDGAAGTTEKVVTISGYPAVEEWTAQASNGSVTVLLGDRFVVKVTGSTVASVDVIHKAIEAIDLKKIAALR